MNQVDFLHWLDEKSHRPSLPTKTLVMGVLNITPDSFSDGGRYLSADLAYDRAMKMVDQGADIIDIGGESARPGAIAVSEQEELDRVMPVILRIRGVHDICISIDTYKAGVMHDTVLAGANMINDISALRTPGSLKMAASLNVPVCLMHMQGNPETMQLNPGYSEDIMHDMHSFFSDRLAACHAAGIPNQSLLVDPGFGFGKNTEHNLAIMQHLITYQRYGLPVILGLSRKKTLGHWVGDTSLAARRVAGLALGVYAALNGVSILRTHDVRAAAYAAKALHEVH